MKFLKRSASPRPTHGGAATAADRKRSEPSSEPLPGGLSSPADGRVVNSGGGGSSSSSGGGSWERWRPLAGSRIRTDCGAAAASSIASVAATTGISRGGRLCRNSGSDDVADGNDSGRSPPARNGSAAAASSAAASSAAAAAATSQQDDVWSVASGGGSSQRSSSCGTASSGAAITGRRRRRRSRRRRVLATVGIVKGPEGFGFTVITARHGQKVNSIIEAERCAGLLRGDLLLSIDRVQLAGLSHDDVVRLLRECAEGAEATIVVRRRDPADSLRLRQEQSLHGSDHNGGAEVSRGRSTRETDDAFQPADAAAGSLESPPPVPPRHRKTTTRTLKPPLQVEAVSAESAVTSAGPVAWTGQRQVNVPGGWTPSASTAFTSHSSLPDRSVELLSRRLQPPALQQQLQQQQQQQQQQQAPLPDRAPQATSLAALQNGYFRQWQELHGRLAQTGREAAAAVDGSRAATAGSLDAHRHELPPPLPPRPRRKVGLNGPSPERPPQRQQQQLPQRPAVVLPNGAAASTSAAGAPIGPAHLAIAGWAGVAAPAATAADVRRQGQQQPNQLQRTTEPVTSSLLAASPDRTSDDGPRDRHLRLLRSLAFSAPSLPESTRRLADEQQQQQWQQANFIPHFATMVRRPAKPDGLRLALAATSAAGGNSADAPADVRWPSAAASWDRQQARSRTPDGPASFWQRARLNELPRGGGAERARPASSTGSLLRRSKPGGWPPPEGATQKQQQQKQQRPGAGIRAGVPRHVQLPLPPSQPAAAVTTAAAAADSSADGPGAVVPGSSSTGDQQVPSATAATTRAAATAESDQSGSSPAAAAAAAAAGDGRTTTLPRVSGQARGLGLPGETPPPAAMSAVGKYQVVELDVTLYRQESGFGFSLVGGPEGGTQVTIGRLAPGGAADLDCSLRTGDELLAVDGVQTAGASHYRVVQLMGGAASRGKVDLRVRRRLHIQVAHQPTWADSLDHVDAPRPPTSSSPPHGHTSAAAASATAQQWRTAAAAAHQQQQQRAMAAAVVTPADQLLQASSCCSITLTQQATDDGFGILVVTPRQQPHERLAEVKIGQILPGTPAARCGRLFVDDRILAINGTPVSDIPHDAVVGLIRERGRVVTITVATGQQQNLQQHQHRDGGSGGGGGGSEGGHVSATGHRDTSGSRMSQGPFEAEGEELNGSVARHDSFLEVSAVPCVGQLCPNTPELSTASVLRRREASGAHTPSYLTDQEADRMAAYPSGPLASQQTRSSRSQDGGGGGGGSIGSIGGSAWGGSQQQQQQPFGGSYCQLDATDDGAVRLPAFNDAAGSHWPAATAPGFSKSTTLPASAAHAAASSTATAMHAITQQPTLITVDLVQGSRGFGFSVRGGHEFGATPLCVLRLAPGGVAESSGKLQVGDEILEINGCRTVGMRHSDAIALIQGAGPSVRLTLRRSYASTVAVQASPVASGEAGSPRSSPTGSSANGSTGCMNTEKWWSHSGHTPPAAAAAAADFGKASHFSSSRGNASTERSKSTSSIGRDFGGGSAAVAPAAAAQRPPKPGGGGLLMPAPKEWQHSSNVPSAPQQQQQQRHLLPIAEPDDTFQRGLSAGGIGSLPSPRALPHDDSKGSRSYLAEPGDFSAGAGGPAAATRPTMRATAATAASASASNFGRPTSGYLSPGGVTGSLRFSADIESSRVAGGRHGPADATLERQAAPVAVAPFGFYETLLRHVPST